MAAPIQGAPVAQVPLPDDDEAEPICTWENVKKVALIGLQILVLGALALWQTALFLFGFVFGFVAQLGFKSSCEKMIGKIVSAIGNRPWLFTGGVIGASIILPAFVLVAPPFVGGFYGGTEFAKLFQNTED